MSTRVKSLLELELKQLKSVQLFVDGYVNCRKAMVNQEEEHVKDNEDELVIIKYYKWLCLCKPGEIQVFKQFGYFEVKEDIERFITKWGYNVDLVDLGRIN